MTSEASGPWDRLVQRALFGFLGFYLGSLVGVFVGLPFGFGLLAYVPLCGLAGAVALAARSPTVRRRTLGSALTLTLTLYLLRIFAG